MACLIYVPGLTYGVYGVHRATQGVCSGVPGVTGVPMPIGAHCKPTYALANCKSAQRVPRRLGWLWPSMDRPTYKNRDCESMQPMCIQRHQNIIPRTCQIGRQFAYTHMHHCFCLKPAAIHIHTSIWTTIATNVRTHVGGATEMERGYVGADYGTIRTCCMSHSLP